ncbi:MAG: response regulator [Flavobacteriales bacterium]|jgi:CheY-like chemotaxis protein|nr:response regulator [Flavobacteriales bacterium]
MTKKFRCILLIDDDIMTNEFHEIIINDADITEKLQTVTSGQEALDYLTNSGKYKSNGTAFPQPDLVLLDINMPAMNGFEFMERYQNLNPNQKGEVVIVMLTSSLNPDDEERANDFESINGYRNKPLTIEMLNELATEYL